MSPFQSKVVISAGAKAKTGSSLAFKTTECIMKSNGCAGIVHYFFHCSHTGNSGICHSQTILVDHFNFIFSSCSSCIPGSFAMTAKRESWFLQGLQGVAGVPGPRGSKGEKVSSGVVVSIV